MQRPVLAVGASVEPSHFLPLGGNAGGGLRRVSGPPAVVLRAPSVVPVQVRILAGHVNQAGIVGPDGAGFIHQPIGRIGGRGVPAGHVAVRDQEFTGQGGGVVELPGELGEPLPALRFLRQVVKGRVLKAAEAAGGVAQDPGAGAGAAELLAIRVHNAGGQQPDKAAHRHRVPAVQGHHNRWPPNAGPASQGAVRIGAHRPVPVHQIELAALGVAEGTDDMAPALRQVRAENQAALGVAVGAVNELVVGGDLKPREVTAGDEVHDPGNGVGAVGGCGPVTQYLDALQGDGRHHVHIDQQLRLGADGVRRPSGAVAVDEHQGAAGAKPADVHRGPLRPGPGLKLVGLPVRPLAERQILDEVQRSGRPLKGQVIPRQGGDGQRRILGNALDVGAGDDDLLNLLARVHCRGVGQQDRPDNQAERETGKEWSGHGGDASVALRR